MMDMRIQSEVFLKADIENILNSIDEAVADLAVNLPFQEVAIYRMGFAAAMQAVAKAFDIELRSKCGVEECRLLLTSTNH